MVPIAERFDVPTIRSPSQSPIRVRLRSSGTFTDRPPRSAEPDLAFVCASAASPHRAPGTQSAGQCSAQAAVPAVERLVDRLVTEVPVFAAGELLAQEQGDLLRAPAAFELVLDEGPELVIDHQPALASGAACVLLRAGMGEVRVVDRAVVRAHVPPDLAADRRGGAVEPARDLADAQPLPAQGGNALPLQQRQEPVPAGDVEQTAGW